jgi:hypothetical protein
VLFLDDHDIVASHNIRRVLNRAVKRGENPVIAAEYPWEAGGVYFYGTVLHDQRRFRMWYQGIGPMYREQHTCYAESLDGVHFSKIMTADHPYGDSPVSNIVMGGTPNTCGPSIVRDDSAPPEARYRIFFDSYLTQHKGLKVPKRLTPEAITHLENKRLEDDWRPPFHRGQFVAHSPDGIHWSPAHGRLIRVGQSDIGQCVLWDPVNSVWRAYIRENEDDLNGRRVRLVHTMTSRDFRTWSRSREILRPDAIDGSPDAQFYGISVAFHRGLFIGFQQVFRIEERLGEGKERGVFHAQLMVSRDGERFLRVADRAPFLEVGESGTWEGGMVRIGNSLVIHDDTMWIYFDARNARHAPKPGDLPLKTGIGCATLPLDRFVALTQDAASCPGEIIVRVPVSQVGKITVNAEIERGGEICASLHDLKSAPIRGFEPANCTPVRESGLRQPISWLSASPPNDLTGTLLLRLTLLRARLYAVDVP